MCNRNKIFVAITTLSLLLVGSYGYAANGIDLCPDKPADQCCECFCRMITYEPCYFTTRKCIEVMVPRERQCTRMVPKYYEVKKCRMVPEYYTVQECRMEKEYYTITEQVPQQKWIEEKHCKWIPRQFTTQVPCGDVLDAK